MEDDTIFSKRWFLFFVLFCFLFFQLVYSFLYPATGFSDTWQPITSYLPKFAAQTSDNFLLEKIYPLVSSEYRLNSDVGGYLELAQNFNRQYFTGHVFLNRPLYPFLIRLTSLPLRFFAGSSYGIIFASAILLNFILLSAGVLLLFSLLEKFFSLKVAFLSAVLLIFSPYVHSSLIQPLAEMLTLFWVILSLYLVYNYVKNPSPLKLIVFSLITGTFVLGKMFFAISIFILLLAIYFKRFKEGIAFLIIHLIPIGLWYLWVTQVWNIPYYICEVQHWQMGVWLLNIFHWPWYETARVLLSTIPNFVRALIYGFLLIPVIFSVLGYKLLPFKSKNIFYFAPFLSLFTLCFIMNLYLSHHAFLLFPIIYPTAVLGIDRASNFLKRYKFWYFSLFYVIIIGLIIILSNLNFYKIFDYLQ